MANNFTRHEIDPDDFADALAGALREGGAGPEEIKWGKFGVLVGSQQNDDAPAWRLTRG